MKFLDSLRSFTNSAVGYFANVGDTLTPFWSSGQLGVMYQARWLPAKIVDVPAFDMFREWRDWQAESDQIELIEEEEARLNLQSTLIEAVKAARLYGGSALFIVTRDADPMLPLEPERIGKGGILALTLMKPESVRAGDKVTDPRDAMFDRPAWYEIGQEAVRVHPSRLVFFKGRSIPGDTGVFGESVLTSILQDIQNANSTAGNIAQLIGEAKVDVFRIKNLMESLSDPEYEKRLLSRLSLANTAKGGTGALIMDFEEEYEQKTMSFGTLPELMINFYQIVSGAADIPMTRLMGMSPAGMNATGESDMRNYYDRIAAQQKTELTPAIRFLDECLIVSALGNRPPEIWYEWGSLWQVSAVEKATIGKTAAETIATLNNTGLWEQAALSKAGTNMLTELGVIPGLENAVAEVGEVDFDLKEQQAAEREVNQAAAIAAAKGGNVTPLRRAVAQDTDEPVSDPLQTV